MRIQVTAGFLLLAAFLIFADNNDIFIWFAASMMVHESAHLAVLYLLGGRVTACRLSLWGASVTAGGLSYGGEIAAALAGPIASLCAAFAASRAGLVMAAGLSLMAGAYNLLPARCLDGGRVVELALSWMGRPNAAYRVLRVTTPLSAAAVGVPLCAAFSRGVYNWTLLMSALFLGLSAFWDL